MRKARGLPGGPAGDRRCDPRSEVRRSDGLANSRAVPGISQTSHCAATGLPTAVHRSSTPVPAPSRHPLPRPVLAQHGLTMAWDLSRLKNHAAGAAVVGALMVAALGVMAFFLALRPCRMRFDPGQFVTYRLRTEMAELSADNKEGAPQVSEREIDFIRIGPENDVVMLTPEQGRDQTTLMTFSPAGVARTLDAAARPTETGRAFGFFDFNLLPLPPGSEQAWNVDLVYAALPINKRLVQGKVRRMRSGSSPEFELKLPPSVEWINEDNRYVQVRDLVCHYRFATGKGLVDQASVHCVAGIEREDGRHRYHVRCDLALAATGRTNDDPRQIRDLAMASREAEDAISGGHNERLATLRSRILATDVQHPRLRELAARLAQEVSAAPAPAAARQGPVGGAGGERPGRAEGPGRGLRAHPGAPGLQGTGWARRAAATRSSSGRSSTAIPGCSPPWCSAIPSCARCGCGGAVSAGRGSVRRPASGVRRARWRCCSPRRRRRGARTSTRRSSTTRARSTSSAGSSKRWEALFEQSPSWVPRQLAYIEIHQSDLILSLLAARLLYRGGSRGRTATTTTPTPRAGRPPPSTCAPGHSCASLRWHRDPALFALLSAYLATSRTSRCW